MSQTPQTPPSIRTWVQEEASIRLIGHEVQRLWSRASRRMTAVLAISVFATAGAVLREALPREQYSASITFRVHEEMERGPGQARPKTKRRLREYVSQAIVTRPRVQEIVERFRLYPDLVVIDVGRAVDVFREDLSIEVFQNYFLLEESDTDAPRSARVRIRFTYPNRMLAENVVLAIGRLIREHEDAERRQSAEEAAQEASRIAARREARLDALNKRQTSLQLRLRHASGGVAARLQVALDQLRGAIAAIEEELGRFRRERGQRDLLVGLEKHKLLLHFEPVAWDPPPVPRLARPMRLALVGLIVLLLFLPIVGLTVATFDSSVYAVEDVEHLGVEVLGLIPSQRQGNRDERHASGPRCTRTWLDVVRGRRHPHGGEGS